ncbi:MAG TPA: hypothetical protein VF230_03025, partial [Acidimicrobiales bacterium]
MRALVAISLVAALLVATVEPAAGLVPIRCSPTVPSVGGGAFHLLLLDGSGRVRAAGDNYFGQIGDNTRTVRPTAVLTSGTGLTGVTSVASSPNSNHSVALKSDGTVWTWGMNWSGQLGNGEVDPDGARPSVP